MSTKQPRHTPSPSSSLSTHHTASKFPKFLQKRGNRDGSRPTSIPTSFASSSTSAAPSSPELPHSSFPAADVDEAPVIVEPVLIPRARTRSERPLSSAPDSLHSASHLYSSTSSTSRIGDLPTRLSGWFSHTFSSSSTDIPSLLAYHSTASPKDKGSSALLTAAKHGKGHLDKAMRYLLDSDAMPDKCTDPIWLLGVQHPGYEPPLPALPNVVATSPANNSNNPNNASLGLTFRRSSASPASPSSFRSSTSSVASSELSQSTNSLSSKIPNPAANWPPVFYIDFTSRIWLTYRSQFPVPIKDGRLADLCDSGEVCEGVSTASSPPIAKSRPWNWVGVVGGEKTWTSDSGWGCMLRTGQSLLANALIHMHLGRGLFLSYQKIP
jgi:cysteine protease ATG4